MGAITQYLFLLSVILEGHAPALYTSSAQISAGRWLATHGTQRDVLLAPLGFSNLVPTMASVRVVAGHAYQTLDFGLRHEEVQTFFGDHSAMHARLRALLATQATLVAYVVQDPEDGSFDPRGLPYLHSVFAGPGITILRVTDTR